MALPGLVVTASGYRRDSAATLLFERLPDRLFAPLASTNRHRYWDLLCRLHARHFGPDAPLPPSRGFYMREIIHNIEEELLTQDAWEGENSDAPDTPLNIRANGIFNYLLDSGWFRIEKHLGERMVNMRPAISKFLSMLVAFAETGPVFVSGKIRSIDINIQQIIQGSADADTLTEAAEQCRLLLDHVRNTGTNIRDIMDGLNMAESTAQYVRMFFSDYIERVFIGDYRELRTREHPLARRPQILRAVEELHTSEAHRKRLVEWYQAKRCGGDRTKAEHLFEKDIGRLLDLRRIDEYLDRLDDEIRRANKRALTFLNYRLRSLQPVGQMVQLAINAILARKTPPLADPFAPGEMLDSDRLAEPRKRIERQETSSLRRQPPSEFQIARSRVMLRLRETRSMDPVKLAQFVRKSLNEKLTQPSEQFVLKSVPDVIAYQALANVGLAMSSTSRGLQIVAMSKAKGFRVRLIDGPVQDNGFISGQPFVVELRQSRKGE